MPSPQITIGVTTFNRVDLLIETIESLRNQKFTNFRVIIANDNPDRKLDAESLGIGGDSRFILINHSVNLGEVRTLNSLLSLADTKYFTWLSDDDLFHPLFIQTALAELERNASAVVFYSAYSTGAHLHTDFDKIDVEITSQLFDKSTFLPVYSAKKFRIIGSYGIFRRHAVLAAGGFHQLGTGFAPYADTLIPILISRQGELIYHSSQFVFLRTHVDSLSNSSSHLETYISAQRDFLRFISPFLQEFQGSVRCEIRRDFFNWFSSDRAGVIRRKPGVIAPLLTQICQDGYSLKNLEIGVWGKLLLTISLFSRFLMSARTLLKASLF